ncbi:MAG: hypothetical protein COA47_13250 [Robiginitomaculum sp.]|nr:MAG: hypothetical protein COA47_13250 [Robiginitomaculum sp.]
MLQCESRRRDIYQQSAERLVIGWRRATKTGCVYASIIDAAVLSPMIEVRTGLGVRGLTMVNSSAPKALSIVVPGGPDVASFHLLRRDKRGGAAKELLSGDL